jgi:hypothetical protein
LEVFRADKSTLVVTAPRLAASTLNAHVYANRFRNRCPASIRSSNRAFCTR